MRTYHTHLDQIMIEQGILNHQLAADAGTSRQAIYKLRKGITRMLPDWAKRLAPHLKVSWQELVEGSLSPVDQERTEWLALFDAMTEEEKKKSRALIELVVRREHHSEPESSSQPVKRRALA